MFIKHWRISCARRSTPRYRRRKPYGITQTIAQGAEQILGHPLRVMRVHYWEKAGRSVWILWEIGKEQPITLGIVIAAGRVEQMRVLI